MHKASPNYESFDGIDMKVLYLFFHFSPYIRKTKRDVTDNLYVTTPQRGGNVVIPVYGNNDELRLTGLTLRVNHMIEVLKISDDACSVVVMHPQNTLIYIDCNLITVSSIVFLLAHGTHVANIV